MVWGWLHNFPASKDIFTKPIDYPDEGWDTIIANWWQDIFDAVESIQEALGYDITGAYDTLKEWLDALAGQTHTQNTDTGLGSPLTTPVQIGNGAGQYLQLPTLTTTQRNNLTPANGMLIYNTTTGDIERYEDGAWSALGVGIPTKIEDSDQDTSLDVEESGDADTIVGKVAGVECLRFHDNGILDLPKQSRCSVKMDSPNQTITHNTVTIVKLDDEYYDNQNEFDAVTNYRFTAKKAGVYSIKAPILWKAPVDGKFFQASVYKNGAFARKIWNYNLSSYFATEWINHELTLAANDYIDIRVLQKTGGNIDVNYYYTLVDINKIG